MAGHMSPFPFNTQRSTPMATAKVIDLTVLSSSPPTYSNGRAPNVDQTTEQVKNPAIDEITTASLGDGELQRAAKPSTAAPRKQKRKKSQQDPTTTNGENVGSGDKRRRREDERGASSRGRSRSPPDRATRGCPLSKMPADSLFFVDDKPADVRDPYASTPAGPSRAERSGGLMLPPHVNVADGSPGTQEHPLPALSNAEEGEEDFINYLDVEGERSIGITRYFHDTSEIDTKTRFVCKNCGEEGNHKAKDCPHQICLTCGARDEHSTRSCPISKTCFTCGMKGHINKTCPNRYASRDDPSRVFDDCDRCGSRSHYTKECPTLWRIYNYMADKERDSTLKDRKTRKKLALGLGGEGYIGTEDWCFNCGDAGHLGDDCAETPHQYDIPREPSAFSEYNTRSGPFFDPRASSSKKPGKKPQRDWDDEDRWGDGHGSSLPINVGKQGKKKERQKMEALDAKAREEEDDFFSRNVKDRAMPKNERNDHKSKHTGIVIRGAAGRFSRDPPRDKPPSLKDRLGPPRDRHYADFPRGGGDGRSKDSSRHRDRDRGRDAGCGRDRGGDRGRDGGMDRSRDGGRDRGPRYHGGYERPR